MIKGKMYFQIGGSDEDMELKRDMNNWALNNLSFRLTDEEFDELLEGVVGVKPKQKLSRPEYKTIVNRLNGIGLT